MPEDQVHDHLSPQQQRGMVHEVRVHVASMSRIAEGVAEVSHSAEMPNLEDRFLEDGLDTYRDPTHVRPPASG
jgi:hypothetical protein